jgi:hypothetical protein
MGPCRTQIKMGTYRILSSGHESLERQYTHMMHKKNGS